MKHLCIIFLVLILFAPAVAADSLPKTVVQDRAEADLLLGNHFFTDGNLARHGQIWEYALFGEASIENRNGQFLIEAEQQCYQRIPRNPSHAKGGFLKLSGNISTISEKEFTFSGQIKAYYLPYTILSGGKSFTCEQSGIFRFSRKEHKQHWRLTNRYGCMEEIPFIDVFVAPLKGEAPHAGCVKNLKDIDAIPLP
jgi:hypothetical protein